MFFFQLPWLPELAFRIGNFEILERLLPSKSDTNDPEGRAKDRNITPYKYTFSQPGKHSVLFYPFFQALFSNKIVECYTGLYRLMQNMLKHNHYRTG